MSVYGDAIFCGMNFTYFIMVWFHLKTFDFRGNTIIYFKLLYSSNTHDIDMQCIYIGIKESYLVLK